MFMRFALVLCLLSMAAGNLPAAFIDISDFTEDAPAVLTDIPGCSYCRNFRIGLPPSFPTAGISISWSIACPVPSPGTQVDEPG